MRGISQQDEHEIHPRGREGRGYHRGINNLFGTDCVTCSYMFLSESPLVAYKIENNYVFSAYCRKIFHRGNSIGLYLHS